MAEKSLHKIKELEDYKRQLESELPPYYDFNQVGHKHQEIEASIIEYWEFLHPIVQDVIISWFQLWNKTMGENNKLIARKEQKMSMLNKFKSSSETKIQNLASKINIRKSEINIIKENLQQKEQRIQDLEETDKENQLGVAGLRSELEKELAEVSLKLTEMQSRFDKTQAQVTQAFENKIMVFESEIDSLKEQITPQERRIQELLTENQQMKSYTQALQILEEKVGEIIDIVASISLKSD
jgi:chromosome segregation ATPase